MSGVETRSVSRDSLFLLATVTVERQAESYRVRVRNLSDGGMMAEAPGSLSVQRGNRLEVELRNVGRIEGNVAWVQDNRFGIAFDREIDSQRARKPVSETPLESAHVVKSSWAHRAPNPPDPTSLRKV